MAKPQWLIDYERQEEKDARWNHCFSCKHRGSFRYYTKHKGKGRYEVKECAIHPGCLNTEFSLACEDYQSEEPSV